MGVDLELEVDTGDVLQILRPDGGFGGKAIYVLSSIYSNYKDLFKSGAWELGWFTKLDQLTQKDPGLINRIMYAGNWNYAAEDYERFRAYEGSSPSLSKADFIKTVWEVANLWTPIDEVIEVVSELVGVLPQMGAETYWFSPHDTMQDFCGLLNALVLAKTRCGRNVRLRCSKGQCSLPKPTAIPVRVKPKLYASKV
jgi:hypothetical protein